jgi:hypothetical protein
LTLDPALEISPSVTIPAHFSFAGPQKIAEDASNIKRMLTDARREFSFALAHDYHIRTIEVGDVEVTLHYRRDEFLALEPTVISALTQISTWLGPFPFNHLSIVETSEVQALGIPGLIAINQPAQEVLRKFQQDILNLQHWNLIQQLVAQWIPGMATVRDRNSSWFASGTLDFVVANVLRGNPREDLFNPILGGFRIASMRYDQEQDLLAAYLQKSSPFAKLTDENFNNASPVGEQSAFLFIRHAMAMRYLSARIGSVRMQSVLSGFISKYKYRFFTAQNFFQYLGDRRDLLTDVEVAELQNDIRQWWEKYGWPDFAISNVEQTTTPDGAVKTRIAVEQLGNIRLPTVIQGEDQQGRKYRADIPVPTKSDGSVSFVELYSGARLDHISLDPDRTTFDEDRFNNRSSLPSVRFFPGNAKMLADDDYTIFWGPYALRRPGEPVTMGLTGALFRYLASGLYFRFETAPTDHLGGFSIRNDRHYSLWALELSTGIEQDYFGSRSISVSAVRKPVFATGPAISAMASLRHRQTVGIPSSSHMTLAGGFKVVPRSYFETCGFDNSAEGEHAPHGLSKNFTYTRLKAVVSGGCNMGWNIFLGARAFRGLISGTGSLPEATLFRINDMQEAMIRVDRNDLLPTHSIISGSAHISAPFPSILPGTGMFLANRLRANGFYDFGRSLERHDTAEYRASGVGLKLPIGGDLTGSGSLTVSSLSFTTVLFSSSAGEINRRPSFLFDISGDI